MPRDADQGSVRWSRDLRRLRLDLVLVQRRGGLVRGACMVLVSEYIFDFSTIQMVEISTTFQSERFGSCAISTTQVVEIRSEF